MNRISRRFIILSLLVIILMGFLIGDARSVQAATTITGYTLQVLSGPTGNCAQGTTMASLTNTVSGTPGGSGIFILNFGLFGVNQALPSNPVPVQDSMLGTGVAQTVFNGSGWTAPGDTPRIQIDVMIGAVSYGGAIISIVCATNSFSVTYFGAIAAGAGGSTCIFTDGRLNCRAEDAAQTAAIYCAGNGGVTVFAVNSGVGKFAFTATKDEIAKVPANPDQNTLIKQAQHIALYRLHGGKMQVNGPNGYVFIWDGC